MFDCPQKRATFCGRIGLGYETREQLDLRNFAWAIFVTNFS